MISQVPKVHGYILEKRHINIQFELWLIGNDAPLLNDTSTGSIQILSK